MARTIKQGQHIFIAFQDGEAALDSQLRPRIYKSREQFEKSFPAFREGAAELIEYAPTIDAVPVVRCKWVCTDESAGVYNCSACDGDFLILDGTPAENDIHYCPNCGAKMDLEE